MASIAAGDSLPVVIGGGGPGGMTTALALDFAGDSVRLFEARGFDPTRARTTFTRQAARDALTSLDVPDPGLVTTIADIERLVRREAAGRRIPVAYQHAVERVEEFPDHVAVTVRAGDSRTTELVRARMFVDASGGRITLPGHDLQRVAHGPHHGYVSAAYGEAPAHDIVGAMVDRGSKEMFYTFPIPGGRGFNAYLDLPPGAVPSSEQEALERFAEITGRLEFPDAVLGPHYFDARHHMSPVAAKGRLVKVGESVGNADPYTSSGVSAAIQDGSAVGSRAPQLRATDPSSIEGRQLLQDLSDDLRRRHRRLDIEGSLLLKGRPLAALVMHSAPFDARLAPHDLRGSRMLDSAVRTLLDR